MNKYNFDWSITQRLKREKQAERGKHYSKMTTGFMLALRQEKEKRGGEK